MAALALYGGDAGQAAGDIGRGRKGAGNGRAQLEGEEAGDAVGGAVGSNPVPLIVGCHRVMGASGRITGYSGGNGIPTKRWLLALEQIESAD